MDQLKNIFYIKTYTNCTKMVRNFHNFSKNIYFTTWPESFSVFMLDRMLILVWLKISFLGFYLINVFSVLVKGEAID